MSHKKRYELAKAYVDKQLKTMEENGLQLTKISQHEYEAMVEQIAEAVRVPTDRKSLAATSSSRS